MKKYRFTIEISNVDEDQVLEATLTHPSTISEGKSKSDFLREDGSIDLEHCFIVLADSGYVEGCTAMGTFSEVSDEL